MFHYILFFYDSLQAFGDRSWRPLGVARREPQSGLVRAVWPQKGHVPKQIHRGLLGLDFKGPQSYSMLGDSLAADLLDALRHVRMQYGAWILSLSVSPMLADAYAMTFRLCMIRCFVMIKSHCH